MDYKKDRLKPANTQNELREFPIMQISEEEKLPGSSRSNWRIQTSKRSIVQTNKIARYKCLIQGFMLITM